MTAHKHNRGRFSKTSIVSSQCLRSTAPSIPLHTRGLRRLLQQWVNGDSQRGLSKPLAEFTNDERNGRDSTRKPNKTLYSKHRTVALATLLALQDAFEHGKTFSEEIGVQLSAAELGKLSLSQCEKVSKPFLKKEGRKMGREEVIEIGRKLYRDEVLDLLPKGKH